MPAGVRAGGRLSMASAKPRAGGGPSLDDTAAQWIVRLTADDPAERQRARAGLDAWKASHPAHADAAEHIERMVAALQALGPAGSAGRQAARGALTAHGARRHGLRLLAGGGLAAGMAGLLGWQAWAGVAPGPLAAWGADLHSPAGHWQDHRLDDGSRLQLGSGTSVDLALGPALRRIELHRGEVLVTVAADAGRPFIVHTPEASIRALGTRMLVRREGRATVLTMLESRSSVQALHDPRLAPDLLTAGQRVRLDGRGLARLPPVDAAAVEQAWHQRRLWADDLPLPEVLDELARHRRGMLRYDAGALAGRRVSAVLPLDDTDAALQLLVDSLPGLALRRPAPWWVEVVDAEP